MCVSGELKRVFLAVAAAALAGAAVSLPAQPYGLDSRPVVGAFLNGALPVAEPVSSGWQAVIAFPNLTFDDAISFTAEPGTNRIHVCERQGKIFHFPNIPDTTNKTLFLDLTAVTQGYNDCGLLGFAFHPEFGVPGSTNRGYVYVYYSYSPSPVGPGVIGYAPDDTPSYNRLSRFTVPDGSTVANPASEQVLINQFDRHLWHNGGGMFFGPDGFLYLSNGDEGGIDDSFNQAQKISSGLFSGVLRIDVNKNSTLSHPIRRQPVAGGPKPGGWPGTYTANYYIPNDNPWLDTNGSVLEEFYAIGFRSPHRMTYDALSGNIWLGDVGQNAWEEVSIVEKGGNYQWAYMEGLHTGPNAKPGTIIGVDQPPVHDYAHADGNNAVIGGYVYRGAEYPELHGQYVFGDNGSGRVWAMTYDGVNPTIVTQICVIPEGSYALSSFGLDQAGVLYMCVIGSQKMIYKLVATSGPSNAPPALISQTGAFTNLATLAPSPALIPFDVNAPLWSDNAEKYRWMAVPNDGAPYGAGETVGFSSNGNWSFPTGAVLVKHFDLPVNDTNPAVLKRLETRFLVHATNGLWYGLAYKWRADNTDADLLPGGLNETNIITTATGVRTQVWSYPSRSDCRTCHNANSGQVLGPRTSQLNGTAFYPATGRTDNQLRTLNHIGLFNTALNETNIPAYPKTVSLTNTAAPLEIRVRSYLESNCAHCHQPGGVRGLFDARFSTPLENQGIVGGPVVDSLGITGARVVQPQNTAQSILHVRDNALGTIQMPPLAKNVVDTNYINLLTEWINNLPPPVGYPASSLGTFGNTNDGTFTDSIFAVSPYINAGQFQAASNMTVALIRAKVGAVAGTYKCAIYADNAGTPESLLGFSAGVPAPVAGWKTFPLDMPITLTNGNYYWLAIWSDDSNALAYYSSPAGTLQWAQYDYGSWPNPIVTTGGGSADYCIYATGGAVPAFVGTPANRTIAELTQLIVTNLATDADLPAQSLTYGLLNPPLNATIGTNGIITWTPSSAQAPSTNIFTTVVYDGVVSVSNSFQVIVTNVNHAPVAQPDLLSRWMSQGISAPAATLLTNDSDVDGDTLSFDSVLSPSTGGASVTYSNASVYYQPVFGDTNADTFNYIVTDGNGGASTGLVSVAVMADPPVTEVLAMDIGGGNYTVRFTGVPGFTYTVQFKDDLTAPAWQNLGVATADPSGLVEIVDGAPAGGERFYRAVRGIAP